MSRTINRQLSSDFPRIITTDSALSNGSCCSSSISSQEEATTTSFFFLSNQMYGGCATFTAHLLHTLHRRDISRIARRLDRRKRNFGYGIGYQNVPLEYFDVVKNIFITDMYERFECLEKLIKREDRGKGEVTIVIHDPGEIFKFNEPYLKYWNIITIRKSTQQFLRDKYGIESKFIYHPFYPYPIQQQGNGKEEGGERGSKRATQDAGSIDIKDRLLQEYRNYLRCQ